MKRLLILILTLVIPVLAFGAGGGGQAAQTGTGTTTNRVVTQVTPVPLSPSVMPQYDRDLWTPQPANSYSTNPMYPRQPAVSNTNGFPIVREPISMRVSLPTVTSVLDYNNNDIIKYMEELTNVRMELELLPLDGATERLNLMFSAGDNLPDIVYGAGLSIVFQVTAGSAGMLIPLQDLIEEHGYNIKRLHAHNPSLYPAMVTADGNIYSLTDLVYNTANQVSFRFWIYEPFLNALGMQMPTTTEEYYRYLIAVRDRDPNGNGQRDEIPLIGSTTGWQMRIDGFLMNAFAYNDMSHRLFRTPTGRIDVSHNKAEWRQGLEYLHRLNTEGLLATESFTTVQAEVRTMIEGTTPIIGSLPGGGFNAFADVTGTRRGEYIIVPPLRGPNGVQQTFYSEFSTIRTGRFSITSNSLIPEVAMKWVDLQFTSDFFTRSRYGVLGRDWIIPPAGTVAVNGEQARYEEILRWGQPQSSYIGNNILWETFASYHRAVSPDPFELEAVLWNARVAYWPYRYMHSVPTQLPFTVDEARVYNDLSVSITDFVNQSLAQFVTGRLALNDANWNTYVQTINNLGLPQLLSTTQTAFDRSWAQALGYR